MADKMSPLDAAIKEVRELREHDEKMMRLENKMEILIEFDLYKENCPWFHNNKCQGRVSYNQHVNDKRYANCEEWACPIFYWIRIIEDVQWSMAGG